MTLVEPGTRLGDYRIVAQIARGGMGELWLAEPLSAESSAPSQVVVKTILPHLKEDEEVCRLFLQEAELCLRFDHANIVHVVAAPAEAEAPYLVMEYVEGVSLRHVVETLRLRAEAVNPAAAMEIATRVCEALAYVHELKDEEGRAMGLIHRDISPENVMLSYDGRVKVLDFGLASTTRELDLARIPLGKVQYVAPEQISGPGEDQRSDIYAVGVLLYECLAGVAPFAGQGDVNQLLAILEGRALPLRKIDPLIPAAMERVVFRAMARDMNVRFASARELARRLRSITGEEEGRTGLEQQLQRFRPNDADDADPGQTEPARGESSAPQKSAAATPGRKTRGRRRRPMHTGGWKAAVAAAKERWEGQQSQREQRAGPGARSEAERQQAAEARRRAAAHFDAGLEYLRRRQSEEALAEWEAALALDPENSLFIHNTAKLRRRLDR